MVCIESKLLVELKLLVNFRKMSIDEPFADCHVYTFFYQVILQTHDFGKFNCEMNNCLKIQEMPVIIT